MNVKLRWAYEAQITAGKYGLLRAFPTAAAARLASYCSCVPVTRILAWRLSDGKLIHAGGRLESAVVERACPTCKAARGKVCKGGSTIHPARLGPSDGRCQSCGGRHGKLSCDAFSALQDALVGA